ncbi:MAG TPA: hypothetical protein VGE24_17105, partial [Emticicia sp.]
SKVIVGEIANTISAEANITYDAGKYILLNPGFSTLQGAVFQSSIGGCSNNLRGNSNENAVTSQTSDKKTEEYLQDIKEMPSLEDFIQQGNNKDLKMILAKFEESKQPFIDSQRKLTFELKSLEKQKTEAQTTSNQQSLNNYYTTKLEKERAFEINKHELDQFSYFIGPVRNERGEKTGYDLTIYAGGKTYLSSIRY